MNVAVGESQNTAYIQSINVRLIEVGIKPFTNKLYSAMCVIDLLSYKLQVPLSTSIHYLSPLSFAGLRGS